MTDRSWEHLRAAGADLAHAASPGAALQIVAEAERAFEVPCSPEAEAVLVFLEGLRGALEDGELIEIELPVAAE